MLPDGGEPVERKGGVNDVAVSVQQPSPEAAKETEETTEETMPGVEADDGGVEEEVDGACARARPIENKYKILHKSFWNLGILPHEIMTMEEEHEIKRTANENNPTHLTILVRHLMNKRGEKDQNPELDVEAKDVDVTRERRAESPMLILPAPLITKVEEPEEDVEPNSSAPTPEGKWEVEKILDFCKEGNREQYLVKWKDWDEDFNTWEPLKNLAECEYLLRKFFNFKRTHVEELRWEKERAAADTSDNKRRKVSVKEKDFILPSDPRPWQCVEQEFYYEKQLTLRRETEEEWELLWKNLILLENSLGKKFKDTIRWSGSELSTNIWNSIKGRVDNKKINQIIGQIIFRRLDLIRAATKEELTVWEASINAVTEGKPSVSVENLVDDEGPPNDFTYVNDYVASEGINIPDDPPLACECKESCQGNKKGCCPGQLGYEFSYTRFKKLRVEPGTPIYECNKKCKCGPDCFNRVVQDGMRNLVDVKLCIFRTSNGCGWGVKTLKSISKGSFVSLYVGEVINTEEAESRGRQYDANGCTYLFDLDFNEEPEGDCPFTVDAAKYGNVSHFINHSCDPNLGVYAVWVNCLDPNLPKIALFALRHISKGEELTFNYTKQLQVVEKPILEEGNVTIPADAVGVGADVGKASVDGGNSSGSSEACKQEPPTQVSTNEGDIDMTDENLGKVLDSPSKYSKANVKKYCLCGAKTCRKVLF